MNPMPRLSRLIDTLTRATSAQPDAGPPPASDAGCASSLHPASHPFHGQPAHGAPWSAPLTDAELIKATGAK